MTFEELKKLIQEGKDEEVKSYIEGLEQKQLTPDGVKEYLETEEGKKVIQPMLDQYFNKGLETWKQNNLEKIKQEAIDQAIKEKYPEETEEQKRLKKLEQDLENERKAREQERLKNKAISEATEKGLPVDLVDHFVGPDEDTTLQNLSKFEQIWQSKIQEQVESKFKEGGHDPHKRNNRQTGTFTKEQLEKMSPEEINANWETISKQMEEGKI